MVQNINLALNSILENKFLLAVLASLGGITLTRTHNWFERQRKMRRLNKVLPFDPSGRDAPIFVRPSLEVLPLVARPG